jgi:uncharacterized protein YecT (DUF1311 family)
MKFVAPVIGLLLATATFASAQEEPEVDCEDAVTQMDMNFCADQDYQEADAELNEVYRQAMAVMREADDTDDVGAVDALKKAQRTWIGYRDEQCEQAGLEAQGGSMEPMLVSLCLADLTRQRTAELNELVESAEN